MTDEAIEARVREAQELAQAAWEVIPEPECWGLESYSDGPPAAGGGSAWFLWFETRERLLGFVGRALPFLSPGPTSADYGAVAARVEALVHETSDGNRTAEDAIVALNSALRGFSQIRWCGTFKDLLAGDEPFVRTVRVWYREQAEDVVDEVPHRAISESEVADFVAALGDWGR